MDILKELHKKAFDFFYNEANFQTDIGYGLIYDHSENQNIATIAGSGYLLTALVIGVNSNYISYDDAKTKVIKSLETLLRIDNYKGFLVHFAEIDSEKRSRKSEYSTIDTALMLNGVLTVDSFFKDPVITKLSQELLNRVDYKALVHEVAGKKYFYMSYNPSLGGAYVTDQPGFISRWDMTAEQLMIYFLASSSLDPKLANELYNSFERPIGVYKGISAIHSPQNALFVYMFPLVWLDLKDYVDSSNLSWYDNLQKIIAIAALWSKDHRMLYKSFNESIFGLSASHSKNGYKVFGSPPRSDHSFYSDGTIAVHAFIGALPFRSDIAKKAILWADENLKELNGKYGFYDAFNLDQNWFSNRYYAINKGLELLALDAYLYQSVYKSYMSHEVIVKGLEILGFKKKGTVDGNN